MSVEKNIPPPFEGFSDDDKRAILARQTEQRFIRPEKSVRDFTNAEISRRDDFKEFCELNGVEPSKRQASKSREDFIKWCDANK